jgi:hypothetical protein
MAPLLTASVSSRPTDIVPESEYFAVVTKPQTDGFPINSARKVQSILAFQKPLLSMVFPESASLFIKQRFATQTPLSNVQKGLVFFAFLSNRIQTVRSDI